MKYLRIPTSEATKLANHYQVMIRCTRFVAYAVLRYIENISVYTNYVKTTQRHAVNWVLVSHSTEIHNRNLI